MENQPKEKHDYKKMREHYESKINSEPIMSTKEVFSRYGMIIFIIFGLMIGYVLTKYW